MVPEDLWEPAVARVVVHSRPTIAEHPAVLMPDVGLELAIRSQDGMAEISAVPAELASADTPHWPMEVATLLLGAIARD